MSTNSDPIMPELRNLPSTIHLRFDDNQRIVVTPEDEDKFVISVGEAVKACRVYELTEAARFSDQFKRLLESLGVWLTEHKSNLTHAILTTRDAGLLFLVASKSARFNDKLEDRLTSLDMEIARDEDFDLIRLSVLAIPDGSPDSIDCFADPISTWTYGIESAPSKS